MKSTLHGKITLAITVFLVLSIANVAHGEISVGVKEGDWIEYEVTTTGTSPEEFNITWARMEILNVQGPEISANVTREALNGTLSSLVMTFNLERGKIGAWFIIPAGLNPDDSFRDEAMGRDVTVEGEQQLTYAGATRTITNATTPERLKRWDKSTGVFVECIDVLDNYSINATAIRTNLWGSELPGLDPLTFQAVVVVFVTAIVTAAILIAFSIRKK